MISGNCCVLSFPRRDQSCTFAGVISAIARKRGYLRKGGKPDLEKAGRALMQDYRSGLLGRITLETPKVSGSAP